MRGIVEALAIATILVMSEHVAMRRLGLSRGSAILYVTSAALVAVIARRMIWT